MLWKQEYNLRELNSMAKGTMMQSLGIKFSEVGEDFLAATMPVDKRTVQPAGILHGGASIALAETIGSVASLLCLENIDEYSAVGVSINANHLKAIKEGEVTGICSPIRVGRKLHVWHIEIFDERESMICLCRLTTMVVPKQ